MTGSTISGAVLELSRMSLRSSGLRLLAFDLPRLVRPSLRAISQARVDVMKRLRPITQKRNRQRLRLMPGEWGANAELI